ncbi:MAG: dihydrolipoyl dehydrogenase [Prevotella sp.]|uniref:dihydrolipoyl dehydrogenase n=1 Tax=Prevotella sp. AGR2160 TaxID=1280674 RepID=UPI00048CB9E6|nr:dihydrolipoyl dehydrogenase [Prevotella sp. AGR2160]MDD5861840.1 dihydrolipoyl dehydrogenase [Prevotella sp.]
MENKSDLIIIGCGPGGYATAAYAARQGLQTVVIEAGEVGGTCLNRGCIPTKCLVHDAQLIRNPWLQQMFVDGRSGLDVEEGLASCFRQAMRRKDAVVSQLREGIHTLLSAPGITLVSGEASFVDAHTVRVGDAEYTAPHILIATGSRSKLPPIEGLDATKVNAPDSPVVTSTGLLQRTALPQRLCIIGAGVIGMEFASIFNAFGVEVTVVEFLKECLPALDGEIARRLRKQMEKRGVKFSFQSAVEKIDGHTVIYKNKKGQEETVEADMILMATGRRPNTDGLNLEAAGIAFDRKGITVDDYFQTSVPGVYAIGDVNGRMMLAHAAEAQGRKVIDEILGQEDGLRLDIIPSAVFTDPEAASVGPTEEALKAAGIAYEVHKSFYRANGKALAIGEPEGMVKILTEAVKDDAAPSATETTRQSQNGRILACHVYGAHAADLVQEVAALMTRDCTLADLRSVIHIHPTLQEILNG